MRHIYFIAEIINAGTAPEWLLTCEVYSEFIIILIYRNGRSIIPS